MSHVFNTVSQQPEVGGRELNDPKPSRHRVLIVGGGSIGERHLRCFLETGRAAVAMCEQNVERLAQLAVAYPLTGAYRDFTAIDLGAFDAVVICVYADLHVPYALRAIEAGAAVLVEKPLSTSLEGLDALEAAALHHQRPVAVAHVRRATRAGSRIKHAVASGRIGDVLALTWTLGYDHRLARPDYRSTYWSRRDQGGGVVLDVSSHSSNYIVWLLGPARSVMAVHDHLQIEETECEDTLAYILRFHRNPAVATVHCSAWQAHRSDLLSLHGTTGTLVYDGTTGRLGIAERGGPWDWIDGLNGAPHSRGQVDEPFVIQAANFLDAMEGKAPLLSPLADGVHTMAICSAVYQSGLRHAEVLLPLQHEPVTHSPRPGHRPTDDGARMAFSLPTSSGARRRRPCWAESVDAMKPPAPWFFSHRTSRPTLPEQYSVSTADGRRGERVPVPSPPEIHPHPFCMNYNSTTTPHER